MPGIRCLICGREFAFLPTHLRRAREYQREYRKRKKMLTSR